MNFSNDYIEESQHHVDMRTKPTKTILVGVDVKTLSLYLGCPFVYGDGKFVRDGWHGIKTSTNPTEYPASLLWGEHFFDTRLVKPVLRPFSSLNDEEVDTLGITGYKDQFIKAVKQNEAAWTPDQFQYLISKRIDIFGLIDKGLAVDFLSFN